MMNLVSLNISRAPFDYDGKVKGNHYGKITFDSPLGEVTVQLTPEHCAGMFAVVADAIVATAKQAATSLMIEAQASQATQTLVEAPAP